MRIVTHAALAKRRRAQASTLSLIGVAILVLGLVLNFQLRYGLAYIALISGTLCSWLGVTMSERWLPVPRPDKALADGLSGISGRVYALYNWSLPSASHVLLAPWGLTVFFVHNHDGAASIEGDRWRDGRPIFRRLLRFARRPVRHPGKLLELDIDGLRAALVKAEPGLADLPIEGAAVFTNPGAQLTITEPDLPVLVPGELSAWVRRSLKDKPRLAPAERLKLEETLDALAAERMGEPAS